MSILSWIGIGKKPKVGVWYMVDWSDPAKELSVGNNHCKKIFQMYNEHMTGEADDYTEAKVEILKQNHQVVIDVTQKHFVPPQSTFVPRTEAALGSIQLFKRVW